jgi:hypothetical protein
MKRRGRAKWAWYINEKRLGVRNGENGMDEGWGGGWAGKADGGHLKIYVLVPARVHHAPPPHETIIKNSLGSYLILSFKCLLHVLTYIHT